MSVDVESWVHRPIFNIPLNEQTKELDNGHVLRSTRIVLDLFRKSHTKATFFVLGTVAEWYPELIEEIRHNDHEIGIHGYTHKRLCDHTRESFDEEIKKTMLILNNLGVNPSGYRSPAFSAADFLYDVLEENGLSFDASVFPVKTPLYDWTSYDCHPFVTDRGITEIPCSVWKVSGFRIPAGGFYLRLLGGRVNYLLLRKIESKYGIAVMYFHPWEVLKIPEDISLNNGSPVSLPFMKKRFAYYNIPMLGRLEFLVDNIDFTNFERAMDHVNGMLSRQK